MGGWLGLEGIWIQLDRFEMQKKALERVFILKTIGFGTGTI